MNKELGDRIKALRISNNLTQETVADSIGISRQRYSRIEQGISPVNFDILAKIANKFSVNISDITKVLDSEPGIAYRDGQESNDSEDIFKMLDLFYANKRLYDRLKK